MTPSPNQRRGRPSQKRRRNRTRRPQGKQEPKVPLVTHAPKTYGVVFYKRLEEAKGDLATIEGKSKECDQLNIVIKTDCDMDDPELCQYGKVFAGEAWTLIHERRIADGWYDQPR